MTVSKSRSEFDQAWDEPWPEDQLEFLEKCPICAATNRELLHDELVDNTFFCARGRWVLWECETCRTAYLDPRPTVASIGLAYLRYYTHADAGDGKQPYESLGRWRKVRRRLVNGYTNFRFGTRAFPASSFGVLASLLVPPMRKKLLNEYRHLPKISHGGASMLDLGCGSGAFLETAKECGWSVVGVDPDMKAIATARQRGFEVYQGGVEVFNGKTELFDAITMNHVIEHLHDPLVTLGACHRLLKPGGQIYIDTPNAESIGHRAFGKYWRGLESPRHMVLFSTRSLERALRKSGFTMVLPMPDRNVYLGMFRSSEAMKQGRTPDDDGTYSLVTKWHALWARIRGATNRRRREFITVVAFKGTK